MNADGPQRDVSGLISIVAPAYNEEGGLGQFTNRVDSVMRSSGLVYEIVFVNDGSTDRTLSVMQAANGGHCNCGRQDQSCRANESNVAIIIIERRTITCTAPLEPVKRPLACHD
jgi:glycosyltransferase involved in cell wall biosynthesis